MGAVRRFAVAGLDQAARRSGRRDGLVTGVLDETGQEKTGTATAGVQRQYPGCAGKAANGISTVHLACVREHAGHALSGARQWIRPPRSPIRAGRRPWDCRRGWSSAPRGSWPPTSPPRRSRTASPSISSAGRGLRQLHAAARVPRGTRPGLRPAGAAELPPCLAGRAAAHLRGRSRPGPGRRPPRGPPGRDRSPGPALIRLVLAGHRLPGPPPAHPPPPQDRRAGTQAPPRSGPASGHPPARA